MTDTLRRVAESARFQTATVVVIVINAVVLGLETYPGLVDEAGDALQTIDRICLAVFVAELAIRIGAHARRPGDFFCRGWNVFDFIVVAAAFVPFLAANATVLRIIRLLRVTRLLAILPDVRILIDGMRRAVRPVLGLFVLTILLVYLYAIVGWSVFGDGDPEHWDNAGRSMMTLFGMLTLEGWIDVYGAAREITPWAWLYFVSFILLGTFVVLNTVLGIVLNSLDEAHRAARRAQGPEAETIGARIDALRDALDDLERSIEHPR